MVTDANPSYDGLDARNHFVKNLSEKNALPAHISLPGIHRVFSNMKRFGMGVYHGFREKHLDATLTRSSSDGIGGAVSRQSSIRC